jgi:hypothetical protein
VIIGSNRLVRPVFCFFVGVGVPHYFPHFAESFGKGCFLVWAVFQSVFWLVERVHIKKTEKTKSQSINAVTNFIVSKALADFC